MLIRGASISGAIADCRIRDHLVTEIGALSPEVGEEVLDARGGALLPGLADHHVHLLAAAAVASSVDLEPAAGRAAMIALLAEASRSRDPVRAIGWFEAQHGDLDAQLLDEVLPGAGPIRVAHRSGAVWILNTLALQALSTWDDPGIERRPDGHPTGRVWRADHVLRGAAPDLAPLARRLAGYGITHLTDATPDLDAGALELLTGGAFPQRLLLLGAPDGWAGTARAKAGPAKIVVGDHALPDPDALAARIAARHAADRAVAIHCVTRAALVVSLAAWRVAGSRRGDRVEHAAVAGPAEIRELAELKIRVVTQPSLVTRRGASYLAGTEAADAGHLWPYASLIEGGVRVACSSDAPYGDLDPWATIRAARDRTTPDGVAIGEREKVPAATAFASLLTDPTDPGRLPRRVAAGMVADLMLLHVGPEKALAAPDASLVRHTFCAGAMVF